MYHPFLAGLFALLVLTPTPGNAGQKAHLQLRLEAADVSGGAPQKIVFVLVNRGRHDIVVPVPTIECGDLFNGTVNIQMDFTPLYPGDSEGFGHGCGTGRTDWPLILDRIKDWKAVHPSESIRVEAKPEDLLFDSRLAGRYELRGNYIPPEISPSDQKILRRVGIEFPHETLASKRLVFRKKP